MIIKITTAFKNVPYPGDNDLTIHPLGPNEYFYEMIKGIHWTELVKSHQPLIERYKAMLLKENIGEEELLELEKIVAYISVV